LFRNTDAKGEHPHLQVYHFNLTLSALTLSLTKPDEGEDGRTVSPLCGYSLPFSMLDIPWEKLTNN
jgi:hypothetical protein